MIFDTLQRLARYQPLHPGFPAVADFLKAGPITLADGRHELDGERLFLHVATAAGHGDKISQLEAHRRYIDIQCPLEGNEQIGWRPTESCHQVVQPHDPERDIAFFGDEPLSWVLVPTGTFVIFYPEDAHAPLAVSGTVRKAIFKVAVDW